MSTACFFLKEETLSIGEEILQLLIRRINGIILHILWTDTCNISDSCMISSADALCPSVVALEVKVQAGGIAMDLERIVGSCEIIRFNP